MRATVTVDVDIKYARIALSIAGYDVKDKTDEEVCEMAIKMNDCYAVKTEKIDICKIKDETYIVNSSLDGIKQEEHDL